MVYNGRLRMVQRNSHGRTVKWVQPLGKVIGQLLDKDRSYTLFSLIS